MKYGCLAPAPPTTIVLMNGLSSSCVLAATTVPTAASSHVRRMATGGLARLVPLPTGAICVRGPAMSAPRVTLSVASALLCAAEGAPSEDGRHFGRLSHDVN